MPGSWRFWTRFTDVEREPMYGILADLTVAVHVAYVAFVVIGEFLILIGWWRGWDWVRNFWFRSAHLAAIGAVVVVEILGVRCPLTIWEESFRTHAGQPMSGETFMSRLMYSLLYFEAPPWAFTAGHLFAGVLILGTFLFCPPRLPRLLTRRTDMTPDPKNRDSDRPGVHDPETTPAEERGERIDTGKSIARGGKEDGSVPGAEPADSSAPIPDKPKEK